MIQAIFEGKEQVVMIVTFSNACQVDTVTRARLSTSAQQHSPPLDKVQTPGGDYKKKLGCW
jgi:hypothetical protein